MRTAGVALMLAAACGPASAQGAFFPREFPNEFSQGFSDEFPREEFPREREDRGGPFDVDRRGYDPREEGDDRFVRRDRRRGRGGLGGSICVTSRGNCPAEPAPANARCGCMIPGFGWKRGAIVE